jgi:hypothetical protein
VNTSIIHLAVHKSLQNLNIVDEHDKNMLMRGTNWCPERSKVNQNETSYITVGEKFTKVTEPITRNHKLFFAMAVLLSVLLKKYTPIFNKKFTCMRKVWPKYRNIERMIRTYENILLKGLVS